MDSYNNEQYLEIIVRKKFLQLLVSFPACRTPKKYWPVLSIFLVATAQSATITSSGEVDGRIRNVDGVANIDQLNEIWLNTAGFRTNTILEFDLSIIPDDHVADSLTLSAFDIADSNSLFVYGYSGDGVISISDALEGGNSLGLFSIHAGDNGPFSLSIEFVNSLISANASHLGLNIGVLNAQALHGISDFSVTFNTIPAPIPLPAAALFFLSALGGLIGFKGVRR